MKNFVQLKSTTDDSKKSQNFKENKQSIIPYFNILCKAIDVSSKRTHHKVSETDEEFKIFFNKNQKFFQLMAKKYDDFL